MRQCASPLPLAVLLGGLLALAASRAEAQVDTTAPAIGRQPGCSCSNQSVRPTPYSPAHQLDARASLDGSDAFAALQALHIGLSEAGDGTTFVWHRAHGRLSGSVRPTLSFKDAEGRVCRHLVVTLTSGTYTRKVEGIACRDKDGGWILEG